MTTVTREAEGSYGPIHMLRPGEGAVLCVLPNGKRRVGAAFSMAYLWNTLPQDSGRALSLASFRHPLKMELLKKAFN